jgi:hypothetical protein
MFQCLTLKFCTASVLMCLRVCNHSECCLADVHCDFQCTLSLPCSIGQLLCATKGFQCDNAAAAAQALTDLNRLSCKPAALQFELDTRSNCIVICVSTNSKKLSLKQQKWARAALQNKTTGGKSAHHVAMGTFLAVLT